MKKWLIMGIVGFTVGALSLLIAQTTVTPNQVRPQITNGVFVNVQGKGLTLANVDPTTMALDTVSIPPILKALPQAPTINERHTVIKPATGQSVVTIPDATYIPASLNVFVNGLLQAPTDDYTLSGTSVTLVRTSATGDIVQLTYRF